MAHQPNREAIEWLCTRLAPELEHYSVGVRVIGAHVENVPESWRHSPNVNFLGTADHATVVGELATTGLFVAPIANSFGAKIKLMDCLSHATPFIAASGALSGVPFLSDVPRIQLDAPKEAPELIEQLLSSREKVVEISDRLESERSTFLDQQSGVWGRLLGTVVAQDKTKRLTTDRSSTQPLPHPPKFVDRSSSFAI